MNILSGLVTSSKTQLKRAGDEGNIESCRKILTKKPELLNEIIDGEFTILMLVCDKGYAESVKYLLSFPDIQTNKHNQEGYTALYCSAYKGHSECVSLLLAHPTIEVNFQAKYGNTALHVATMYGHEACISLLINHPNVDINLQDLNGDTALHLASRYGRIKCVSLLINQREINIYAKMKDGKTAKDVCCDHYSHKKNKDSVKRSILDLFDQYEKGELFSKQSKTNDVPCSEPAAISLATTTTPEEGEKITQKELEKHKESDDEEERYLKEALAEGKQEWRRSKIMLVGAGRAGKSALANSISGRAFQDTDSTRGINELICSISQRKASKEEQGSCPWSEYKEQKKRRELEAAVAQLVFDKKSGGAKEKGKKDHKGEEEMIKMMKKTGGYVEEGGERTETGANKEGHQNDEKASKNSVKRNSENERSDKMEQKEIENSPSLPGFPIQNHGHPSSSFASEAYHIKEQEENLTLSRETTLDSSLVMQYLGEAACVESNLIVSVFDFGGQSVFNVIHAFFLTRCGVYVLVFNMEWLLKDDELKSDCLSDLTFWINSIITHTQVEMEKSKKEKVTMAPIFLVGTRKDLVSDPAQHQKISTILHKTFRHSLAWPFVVENLGAEGRDGRADLCFFPINNKEGHQDSTVRKLLKMIERTMEDSSYVHLERPLSWFQVLDAFKAQHAPFLAYEEVRVICAHCGVPADKVPFLLHFFHEMGILMWLNEDGLREIVVFDPIECFVKPATLIICKHNPDEKDGIYHVAEIHREVRKTHYEEFQEMTERGIISESLLQALLIPEYGDHYDYICRMMVKFGLLVPLVLQREFQGEKDWHAAIHPVDDGHVEVKEGEERLYLAPSLLPLPKNSLRRSFLSKGSDYSSQFCFVFTAGQNLLSKDVVGLEDCRLDGFLPQGLFEKLIGKALQWSMHTSNFVSRSTLYDCYQNAAVLAFGNQTFKMQVEAESHLISVMVEGRNPRAIHDRLREQLEEIISECMKSLKFFTVLKLPPITEEVTEARSFRNEMALIRLKLILSLVKDKSEASLMLPQGKRMSLSAQKAMAWYSPWLEEYSSFDEYDLFLSYRWGERDSKFTSALFDRLSLYSIEESNRAIRTFLDNKRLAMGENFQTGMVKALIKSRMMIPIVSADALQEMIKKLEEGREDNLLIEWICGLECVKQRPPQTHLMKIVPNSSPRRVSTTVLNDCRLSKIMPVFFGSVNRDGVMQNLFLEKVMEQLPEIVPVASLLRAQLVMSEQGLSMSEQTMKMTVKEIVGEMTKYLSLLAWQMVPENKTQQEKRRLTELTAEKIVPELQEILATEQQQQQQQLLSLGSFSLTDSEKSHPEMMLMLQQLEATHSFSSPATTPKSLATMRIAPPPTAATDERDYATAWECLDDSHAIDPSGLKAFLQELDLFSVGDLELLDEEDYPKLATFLKKVSAKRFKKALHLME